LYDSDCPPKDNIKGKCINNVCQWPPCAKNEECVDNYCCDKDPAILDADKGNGTCNWSQIALLGFTKISIFATPRMGFQHRNKIKQKHL